MSRFAIDSTTDIEPRTSRPKGEHATYMKNKHSAPWIAIAAMLIIGPFAISTPAAGNDTTTLQHSQPQLSTILGSLDLSGVRIAKGDRREKVVQQLSRFYELQKLKSAQGEEDSWLISEKEQPDNYVGVVSFDSGRVRRVARFRKWTQDDDSVELAQRLCDILERLTRERGNQANIMARTNRSGGVSIRGVEVVFGDKRLSFNIVSRDESEPKQTEVHLDEVIQ